MMNGHTHILQMIRIAEFLMEIGEGVDGWMDTYVDRQVHEK